MNVRESYSHALEQGTLLLLGCVDTLGLNSSFLLKESLFWTRADTVSLLSAPSLSGHVIGNGTHNACSGSVDDESAKSRSFIHSSLGRSPHRRWCYHEEGGEQLEGNDPIAPLAMKQPSEIWKITRSAFGAFIEKKHFLKLWAGYQDNYSAKNFPHPPP